MSRVRIPGFGFLEGGVDGVVSVWEDVGGKEGQVVRDWSWKAGEAPVGGAAVRPGGGVVATCLGGWTAAGESEVLGGAGGADEFGRATVRLKCTLPESSLKIWQMGSVGVSVSEGQA